MLWSVPIKGQGEATVIGNPLKLSRTPATVRLSPPLLDEHKDEVLEWLADAQPQPV
jgi:crotonobetainyl-CoA:carnitine CoA-transferase CaiB-like acyl-CoA transferase